VDASPDSLLNETIKTIDKPKSRKYTKGTSSVAVIRHLYVNEQYRAVSAQDDLISFAVNRAFESSPAVEKIRVTPSPFAQYVRTALKAQDFEVVERGPKVGAVFGLSALTYEISREKWKAKQ